MLVVVVVMMMSSSSSVQPRARADQSYRRRPGSPGGRCCVAQAVLTYSRSIRSTTAQC